MESHNNLSNAEFLTSLRDINLLWQYLQTCRNAGKWWMVSGRRHLKWELVDSWLNLCAEGWGSGSLRSSERLLHPLSTISFCVYNFSSFGPVSMTPPPLHTVTNSNLTGITEGTARWENTGLLQVTARRDALPQTQRKISADGSGASLEKRDTWDHKELLSLHISPSLSRWSVHRQSISCEVSAFWYLLSNALVWLV